MKQAGRVHWLLIFAVLAIILIGGLAFFSGGSPSATAADFLRALQRRDVDKLTELSNMPKDKQADLRKQWEFTTRVAAPYYNFVWSIKFLKQITPDQAVVAVSIIKAAENPNAFEESFELPMVRVDGVWKVDVFRLSRGIYPALPRADSPTQ